MEEIEKKVEVDEKKLDQILDMLKKNLVNMKFLEEEIVIDVRFVDESTRSKMIVDSGVLLSILSDK